MGIVRKKWIDKDRLLREIDFKLFYKTYVESFMECSIEQAIGICPFHDDHNPSFSINIKNGLWNCFSDSDCGGGNVFSFYMKLKGVDFRTAIKEIQNARNKQFN